MKNHLTILGTLNIGMGLLGLFIAAIILLGTLIPGLFIMDTEAGREVMTFLVIIGITVGGFFALLSLGDIVSGIGLIRVKPWARTLAMIVGVIKLVNIPIGTVIGAYSLWVLAQADTQQLFALEAS